MSNANRNLVFLGAKRTPFGSFGGSLKSYSLSDLTQSAAKAALEQAKISPTDVQSVVVGSVLQSTADAIYVARHTGLKSGVPISAPALNINRLCGSGFQVLVDAQSQMFIEDVDVALVGGVENMSATPFMLRQVRWGSKMGHGEIEDYLTAALTDTYCGCPMAITAENLAEQYKLSRTDCDEYALLSQQRVKAAVEKNYFEAEIAPFEVIDAKKNKTTLTQDEHPKPQSTLESLAKLKTVFKKDGVVTAGNASGIVDGASMLVVATEQYAQQNKLSPLGRMVSFGTVGVEPSIMGIGPVNAIKLALKRANMTLNQIDLIEVNEAFAAQYLAVEKELQLDRQITNVNGGAIAIGHPLAASGSRIITHLLYELRRRKKRFGIGAACIGGGQGIAIIVEAFPQ